MTISTARALAQINAPAPLFTEAERKTQRIATLLRQIAVQQGWIDHYNKVGRPDLARIDRQQLEKLRAELRALLDVPAPREAQ